MQVNPNINSDLFLKIADVIEKGQGKGHTQLNWKLELVPFKDDEFVEGMDDVPYFDTPEAGIAVATECNTACCIAGWAVHLTPVDQRPQVKCVRQAGRILLGLRIEEAAMLFSGDWFPPGPLEQVSFGCDHHAYVVKELRRIAASKSLLDPRAYGVPVRLPEESFLPDFYPEKKYGSVAAVS